jgi:ATP-dependent Clp protease ATP-binding subunit ClpA
MFERFTERARHVVVYAQEEARDLRHHYVGTEHLLLGLIREREGIAARVLAASGITEEGVLAEVVRAVGRGDEVGAGELPFTPRLTEVVKLATREALTLGCNDVDTEHLLLGLIREGDGVGAQILRRFDAEADPKFRNEVIRTLSGSASAWKPVTRRREPGDLTVSPGWFEGVGALLDALTVEIRAELKREPDSGDLLVALSCISESLVARTFQELGLDAARLAEATARMRSESVASAADRIEQVRQRKEMALEAEQFELARELREEERRLTQALRSSTDAELEAIHRRLGIPRATDS